jgi:hypothetical protein
MTFEKKTKSGIVTATLDADYFIENKLKIHSCFVPITNYTFVYSHHYNHNENRILKFRIGKTKEQTPQIPMPSMQKAFRVRSQAYEQSMLQRQIVSQLFEAVEAAEHSW